MAASASGAKHAVLSKAAGGRGCCSILVCIQAVLCRVQTIYMQCCAAWRVAAWQLLAPVLCALTVLGWRRRCGAARMVCLVLREMRNSWAGWLSLANSRHCAGGLWLGRYVCALFPAGMLMCSGLPPPQLVMHCICPCLVHGCWSWLGTRRLLLQRALVFRSLGTPPVSLFVAHLCMHLPAACFLWAT